MSIASAATTRHHHGRTRQQAGFGLIQAVVLLLLVASALAAGLLLLQSRRGAEQAQTQEDSLRWADDAVTAFASANSRLPCPARSLDGVEDCSPDHDSGWLPLGTLLGASGTAPGVGPLRYAVYRGEGADHLDLTAPQNAYQPRDAVGDVRVEKIEATDGSDEVTEVPYESVNGLDLCRALGLAAVSTTGASLASTSDRNALPVSIAYGLAAAGPERGDLDRFDGGNTGSALESPWRRSDAGYDDRVRTRTFASAAHAVGCRQISDATVNITPYNAAVGSVDILAAAMALHDSVADLQDNNIGNAEAAVRDAGIAQAMAAAQLVLAAGHIVDTVTSNITAIGGLVRAIGTCIASFGATCWEVPLKASAIAMQVASIISYGVAVGVNVGTVTAAAQALSAAVKARDRAKEAVAPPVANLAEARDKICRAAHGGYLAERKTVKRDADGNVVWLTDADGKPVFDDKGVQLYEYETEYNVWEDGLEQQAAQADEAHQELLRHTAATERMRIEPFNDGAISSRIDQSASWNLHGKRYVMIVQECRYTGANSGEWNSACQYVGSYWNPTALAWVGNGSYQRLNVEKFNLPLATSDAIAKRTKAEAWVRANVRASEAEELFKQADDNLSKWRDTMLPRMEQEATDSCKPSVTNGDELKLQICENNKNAVHFTRTCEKTEYVDGVKVVTLETKPSAPCMPRIQAKRDAALQAKNTAGSERDAAYVTYDQQLAPLFRYPTYGAYPSYPAPNQGYFPSFPSTAPNWFQLAMLEDGKTAAGNTAYKWKDYTSNGGQAFYATAQNTLLERNNNISPINCFFSIGNPGTLCQRYPYSRAYSDYLSAKAASDEARAAADHLATQYQVMADRCASLDDSDPDIGSGTQSNLVIGAEAILRLADELGSVGRQPAPATAVTP